MPLEPALRLRLVATALNSRAAVLGSAPVGGQVEAALGFMFRPGDRVVDRVTGLEGTIDAGYPADRLVPVARPYLG
jgi:hypothetical protein